MIGKLGIISLLYFLTGLTFLLFGWFNAGKEVDIAVHDTYYVVAYNHFFTVPALYLLLCSLIAFLFQSRNKPLPKILNVIVYVLSTLSLLIILLIFSGRCSSQPSKFSDYSVMDQMNSYNEQTSLNLWLMIAVGLLFVSVLSFMGMVAVRIFKK